MEPSKDTLEPLRNVPNPPPIVKWAWPHALTTALLRAILGEAGDRNEGTDTAAAVGAEGEKKEV